MVETEDRGSIVKSTLQVSVAVLIIKILGVLKQSLVAAFYGADSQTDAYFVSTGVIVSLCSVIFSAISISLLSMHSDRLIKVGRKSSNNLINVVLRVFTPISVLIALLFYCGSSLVAKILAPSYTGQQLTLLSHLISVMSPMFVFTCYYLIINVVLETDKIFLPGKGQGFFQNLFVCIAAVLGSKTFGIRTLVYAFLLAGIAQCIQITFNARKKVKFVRHVNPESAAIKKLLELSFPLIIGNAIYEINDIVDKQISTGLGHGNVSFLSYGASINEMVTTLIIQSVSTVLFSHYATWVAKKDYQRVGDNFKHSIEALVAIIMPVMIMCFVCGTNIVGILYGRGNFGNNEIMNTASVVYGYACGFLFQATRATLVRIYYAFQNTKTPMINGAISVGLNICMSIALSRVIGVGGVALATSISMFIVSALLFPGVKKYIPGFSMRSTIPQIIRTLACSAITCVAAVVTRYFLHTNIYVSFVVIGLVVVAVYSILGFVFKIRAVTEMYERVISKARKP